MDMRDIPIELIDQIGTVKNISYPRQGHTSVVVRVDTSDRSYIIKKTEHDLYNRWLAEEYAALQHLAATGLPIPRAYAFHVQDESRWLLMDYLDGISVRHYLESNPSQRDREKVISSYGECLKHIHRCKCPVELRKEDQAWLDMMLIKARYNIEHHDVDGTEELLLRLDSDRPAPIASTLIHGDYHTNNVLVSNNCVVGIIDWPRAAFGDPRFDIALAIRPKKGIFDREGDKVIFLESYGRTGITDDEYRYYQEGLYTFF
jgi:aminoglycoside phosphotransferase (APT) family kinase protein